MAERGGKRSEAARVKYLRWTIRNQERTGLAIHACCLRARLKSPAFRWWQQELARGDDLVRPTLAGVGSEATETSLCSSRSEE